MVDERYHRTAETVEDENPPLPITRDEAKKRIERLIEHVVETQGNLWSEDGAWYFYDALATLLPPCACGGKEPIAVVRGWCRRCDTEWDGLGEWVLVLEEEATVESLLPVRVLVLEGKP